MEGEARLRERLRTLHRILGGTDLEPWLFRHTLLREAIAAFDLEYGAIGVLRDGTVYPQVSHTVTGSIPISEPTPADTLISGIMLERNMTMMIADTRLDPATRNHPLVQRGCARAFIGVPLDLDGQRWFFTIASDTPRRAFSVDDRIFVELLAAVLMHSLRGMQMEMTIERLANFDRITGLPIREPLDRRMEALAASGNSYALLTIDLGLDTLPARDDLDVRARLLAAASARLDEVTTPRRVAYRGGDDFDFAVVADDVQRVTDVDALVRALQRVFEAPFRERGRDHLLIPAVGVGIAPRDGTLAPDVMATALRALGEAQHGRDVQGRYAASEGGDELARRRRILDDLHGVADRGELLLLFQPVVDLATEDAIGVEALVRWQHPELGLIYPGEFVPLAEEAGMIVPIGTWVLRAAAQSAARFHNAGTPVVVAVNVASDQLRDLAFVDELRQAAEAAATVPGALVLEVTETAALRDIDATVRVLKACRAMGTRIALDDFGTGYSSLAYLRELPADIVKIDQSFVALLPDDPDSAAIAGATLALAHRLNRIVHAEGVANAAQLAWLRAEGCDCAQGYFFSRPLDAGAIGAWLSAPRAKMRVS